MQKDSGAWQERSRPPLLERLLFCRGRRGHDIVNQRRMSAELFGDAMAHAVWVFEISRDELAQVDRFSNVEEDVAIGELTWPLDQEDFPLQLEDHFREPFLRRVQIDVVWLPCSHFCHKLEGREVEAKRRHEICRCAGRPVAAACASRN